MTKNFEIRNSTAEFLIFQLEGKADGVRVVYRDEIIWATQKAMAELFDVDRTAIAKHLWNIHSNHPSCCKMQYVPKLHILPKTARRTTHSSTTSMSSSPLAIV